MTIYCGSPDCFLNRGLASCPHCEAIRQNHKPLVVGECDCCGHNPRILRHHGSVGGEGYFCRKCDGDDLIEDESDVLDEIERLRPKAENGKQWAHLCALDACLTEMRQ